VVVVLTSVNAAFGCCSHTARSSADADEQLRRGRARDVQRLLTADGAVECGSQSELHLFFTNEAR
jgi:hypothetical protein